MAFYRQCTLKKGTALEVAWIPEEFATNGKYPPPVNALHAVRHVALRSDGPRWPSLPLPGVRPRLAITVVGSHAGLQRTHG